MFLGQREIQVTLTYIAGSARLMFPKVHGTFPSNIHVTFFLKTLPWLPTALRIKSNLLTVACNTLHTLLFSLLQQHLQASLSATPMCQLFPTLEAVHSLFSLPDTFPCRSHTWFLRILLGFLLKHHSLQEVFPAAFSEVGSPPQEFFVTSPSFSS